MAKSHSAYQRKNCPGGEYFQSAAFNQRAFLMYRQWLESIAVNRFKWVNLPPTCDERYLEINLYFQGVATIAHPEGAPDLWYSLMAAPTQQPNCYDNPKAWTCLGQDGTNFTANPTNGVIIYDNRMRLPLEGHLEMYARRLAEYDRTLDINMLQQRTPFFITGPKEKELDITNVMKSIAGGEPGVVGYDNLTDLIHVEAIQTGVPCLAEEIQTAKHNLWNDIYRLLGIDVVNEKAERLISDEVNMQNTPSELMALDPLTARREACDAFNETFEPIDPLEVYWKKDWEGDTYDVQEDPLIAEEADSGAE